MEENNVIQPEESKVIVIENENVYWYIKLGLSYSPFGELLDPAIVNVGETWEDYLDGKWVKLSNDLIAFHEANPTASIQEVWNMQLFVPTYEPTEEELLQKAKDEKIAEITQYDDSSSVNSFNINGLSMWLTVEERQQLATQINANEAIGRENMSKWFGGQQFTFPISTWKQMLVALEVYAGDALNVTEAHKAAVQALTTIQEVSVYNYRTGYPNKLNF